MYIKVIYYLGLMKNNANHYESLDSIDYLKEDEIDEWCKDNKYIKDYYRKTNQNWSYYIKSLFRLHNETVNIWSHLLGFICILSGTFYINFKYDIDKFFTQSLCFNIFTVCMMICYLFSSIMHLFYPKNESVCHKTQFMDYLGINFLIASTFATFVYFAFYCDVTTQIIYYVSIIALSILILPISKMKIFMQYKFRWIRPTVFFIYASSFIVPIVHRIILREKNDNVYKIELWYFIISASMYIIGISFYITRFPERYKEGFFDIFGSSHQLFHIFVLLGGVFSLIGVLKALNGDNNISC